MVTSNTTPATWKEYLDSQLEKEGNWHNINRNKPLGGLNNLNTLFTAETKLEIEVAGGEAVLLM